MARVEHALPASWIDEVFEQHRQQRYSRELLFSTVVRRMMLVALGLLPLTTKDARIKLCELYLIEQP